MKIKRYIVQNMQEALYLIKQDLGPEAIIVSSRKVKEKGLLGWLRPAKLEVTAAKAQERADQVDKSSPVNLASSQAERLNRPVSLAAHKIRQCLLRMEIEPEIVEFLLEDIELIEDETEIKAALQQRLHSVFKPAARSNKSPNIMAFVGVPGVGKTTTLAKIAAIYSLFDSFNIGLITIDTFRVGAVEQLRIYGDIIGASVDVVTSPAELLQAVNKNRDKDLILIDTAGRPSRNRYQLSEMKAFLEVIEDLDIFLVINATTRARDMVQIINDYKVIPYSQLIISKIDETETSGTLLNAAYLTGMPIAFLTNGQDVPDDIEAASPELLAGYIMKGVVY